MHCYCNKTIDILNNVGIEDENEEKCFSSSSLLHVLSFASPYACTITDKPALALILIPACIIFFMIFIYTSPSDDDENDRDDDIENPAEPDFESTQF